jgi:hypothetical protein
MTMLLLLLLLLIPSSASQTWKFIHSLSIIEKDVRVRVLKP